MFDVDHVSKMLKNGRIKKNLTQSELADRIGVTYQAVSNWERGNALPDISNLPRICEILSIDLYDLIGVSKSGESMDEILSGTFEIEKATIKQIASLAPMIAPEDLSSAVRAKQSDISDFSILVELAPFIEEDLVEEIGKRLDPSNIGEVVALSPFVSKDMCEAWIEKLEENDDFNLDVGLLSALGPYLSQEKMDHLSERVVPDTLIVLDAVAPFLSQNAFDNLVDRLESITEDDYMIGMECLSPFMSKDTMKRLIRKIVYDHDE